MLVAGTRGATLAPATTRYLWPLRIHRKRTVIRPKMLWTTFTSKWIMLDDPPFRFDWRARPVTGLS
jgi:hypothetical protein